MVDYEYGDFKDWIEMTNHELDKYDEKIEAHCRRYPGEFARAKDTVPVAPVTVNTELPAHIAKRMEERREEDFQRVMEVTNVEYGTGVKQHFIRSGIMDVFERGGLLHKSLSRITVASTIIHKEWKMDY